ncbi:MAG: RNA polymerase sigma factor [Limisphaerales bacterium]
MTPTAATPSATDEQAMWRVQSHDDPEAFAEIVGRWQGPIRNLCLRMTADLHRAEDLAQETFARLHARRREWQPTAKLSTYLWRIALNLCHDENRRRTRHGEVPLETGEDGEHVPHTSVFHPTPHEELESEERADQVRLALQRVTEPFRTVLVLRHYEGLKFREIADVLGVPEGTVKSRMVEGLSQLTRLLQPALNDAPAANAPATPAANWQPRPQTQARL